MDPGPFGWGLNIRQIKGGREYSEKGKITGSKYREINEAMDKTASRNLEELTDNGIINRRERKVLVMNLLQNKSRIKFALFPKDHTFALSIIGIRQKTEKHRSLIFRMNRRTGFSNLVRILND